MPGQALEGLTSFAWHEGGAFLIMRSEMKQPEIPPAIAVFGSDDNGDIRMIYFDQRGVSRHFDVSFDNQQMVWKRDDPELSQRMTFTISPDGKVIHQTGRMSESGGPWQDDLSLTYRLDEFAREAASRHPAHPPGR
jgi:hypothetical protein